MISQLRVNGRVFGKMQRFTQRRGAPRTADDARRCYGDAVGDVTADAKPSHHDATASHHNVNGAAVATQRQSFWGPCASEQLGCAEVQRDAATRPWRKVAIHGRTVLGVLLPQSDSIFFETRASWPLGWSGAFLCTQSKRQSSQEKRVYDVPHIICFSRNQS